jgi:hypothetical protein
MRLPLLGGRGLSFRQRAPFARRVEQGSEWLEAIARERELGGSALATPAGQRLLEQDDDTLRAALFAALIASEPRQTAAGRGLGVVVVGGETWLAQSAASELATALARRKLSYTIEDVQLLLAYANGAAEPWTRFDRLRVAVAAAESFAGDHGVAAIEQDLRRTLDRVERNSDIGRGCSPACASSWRRPRASSSSRAETPGAPVPGSSLPNGAGRAQPSWCSISRRPRAARCRRPSGSRAPAS